MMEQFFPIGIFSSEETVNCANDPIGKITSKLSVNIAFRQVIHFQINDQDFNFAFSLIALVS